MRLSRLLRAGVLCFVLLVPALVLAPLAEARPAAAKTAHKKKCKKGYHRVKGKCKKNKRKPVGLLPGETDSSNLTAADPRAGLVPHPTFDTTGNFVVIAGPSSTTPLGSITAVKYYADRAGTIRFLLVEPRGAVEQMTADIPVVAAPGTYTLPVPWVAGNGYRLGLWEGSVPAIGYCPPPPSVGTSGGSGQPNVMALLPPNTPTPRVGAPVSGLRAVPRAYSFAATVGNPPAEPAPTSQGLGPHGTDQSFKAPLALPLGLLVGGSPVGGRPIPTVVNYKLGPYDSGHIVGPIICTPPPGSALPNGDTKVTCSAKDTLGRVVTDSFIIAVLPRG